LAVKLLEGEIGNFREALKVKAIAIEKKKPNFSLLKSRFHSIAISGIQDNSKIDIQ